MQQMAPTKGEGAASSSSAPSSSPPPPSWSPLSPPEPSAPLAQIDPADVDVNVHVNAAGESDDVHEHSHSHLHSHSHSHQGGGDVNAAGESEMPPPPLPLASTSQPTSTPAPRRPGKARVLTEADLDLESGNGHHGHGHGHGSCGVSTTTPVGSCHGFTPQHRTGEWINAGFAENIFGGTAHGRRILPAARAARIKWRLIGAACISGAYAVAELTAAHFSGSTALLADAMHMLSDFASYAISLGLLWLTNANDAAAAAADEDEDEEHTDTDDNKNKRKKRKPSTTRLTYGLGRLEVLGALAIILIVWIATGALVIEAVQRLADPPEVDGRTVAITAMGGLAVNAVLLKLLGGDGGGGGGGGAEANSHGHSHGGAGELSQRAMFLHVLGDTAGTLVVAAGGGLVWGMNGGVYTIVDPICTLIFACLVCATTFPFAVELTWVLLESAPRGIDAMEVGETIMRDVPGVTGVHCIHVWQFTPSEICLTAHVHVEDTHRHWKPPGGPGVMGNNNSGIVGGGGFGLVSVGGGMGFSVGPAKMSKPPTTTTTKTSSGGNCPTSCDITTTHEEVLKKAIRVCARKFGINHVTLQVTAVESRGGLLSCGAFE